MSGDKGPFEDVFRITWADVVAVVLIAILAAVQYRWYKLKQRIAVLRD